MIHTAYEKVISGELLDKDALMELAEQPLAELAEAADAIRKKFCGDAFDLCTIINGKSGRCSEDCKYCAQSRCYQAEVEEYPLLEKEQIEKEAEYNGRKGVLRFSVVTAGRKLSDREIDALCETYRSIKEKDAILLCASHGMLNEDQFRKLKEAGVSRYHNNLESCEAFFPNICTTHSYQDKIRTIRAAQKAELEVCSGGIIGMGETMEHRIDLALALRELGIRSVPINVLNPIPGTPFENREKLTVDEVKRTVAVFRFALPNAFLRLAGGRGLLEDKGESVFRSGANAAISGDMLTTAGINIDTDKQMAKKLGFEVVKK